MHSTNKVRTFWLVLTSLQAMELHVCLCVYVCVLLVVFYTTVPLRKTS